MMEGQLPLEFGGPATGRPRPRSRYREADAGHRGRRGREAVALPDAGRMSEQGELFVGSSSPCCVDCGTSVHRTPGRRARKRCPECAAAHQLARDRKRRAKPEYRHRRAAQERERRRIHGETINAKERERRRTDPEYREKRNAACRTPKARKRVRENRARKAADPDWQQHRKNTKRKWEQSRRADPEVVKKIRAAARENRKKRLQDSVWAEKERKYAREYSRKYRTARHGSRGALVKLIVRQYGLCALCERRLPDNISDIHVDHIIPISRGGTSGEANLQATCAPCNMQKGAKLEAQKWGP